MAKTSPGFSCSQVPSLLHACLINSQQVCIPIAFLFSLRRKEKKKKPGVCFLNMKSFILENQDCRFECFQASGSSFWQVIFYAVGLCDDKSSFFVLFCFTPSYWEGNRQEGQGSPKEETGCNCLISPWSGRKKQTTSVRFFCLYKIKRAFLW